MSLKLKNRRVYFERQPAYPGKRKIITGKIYNGPIWLYVLTDDGDVTKVEENNLHFDLKKRGKVDECLRKK